MKKREPNFEQSGAVDCEGSSVCHAPMSELEREFDAVDSVIEEPAWEQAAFYECARKLDGKMGDRYFVGRNKKPANDNGRSS